jgi:hypothetical protein
MNTVKIAAVGLLFLLPGCAPGNPEFGQLPLTFEENRGQAPDDARFVARGMGYNLLLTSNGNEIALRNADRAVSIRTLLIDANPQPRIRGEQEQAGKVHYLRGSDPGGWLTGVPTYARVRYESVYDGIDLVYYGNQSQLEYDFVVHPGVDPNSIVLGFDGVTQLRVDDDGNLVLRSGQSEVIQRKPILYQAAGGNRREVQGGYRIVGEHKVAFETGAYNTAETLIIDPVLTYSTFLGGTDGDDDGRGVATDSAGNVYLTGSTTSTDFRTLNPYQGVAGSQDPSFDFSDAFVTKLNASGTALVYSTYFGGSSDDDALAIAVDSSGSAVIAGRTESSNLPTTAGALRATCNTSPGGTCFDAFVTKLNSAGSGLVYSTYLGGNSDDEARSVAIDASGNAYVAGKTLSTNFTTTPGAFSTNSALGGFVTKFGPAGAVVYSTYFGVDSGATEIRGIAVDSSGNAYVTGSTPSSATTATDVFVAKLSAAGSATTYAQYIRGSKDDSGLAIAVDAAGNAYVTGQTASINFMTTTGVVQRTFGGGPAFRSSDAGGSWTASNAGMTRTSLYALASAATTPPTTYAGADDELAGDLLKSTDGGVNWTSAIAGLSDARIHAFAVNPATPAIVYAGTRTAGVYKSTNSGASWASTGLNTGFITAFAIDPLVPETIYAGVDRGGIYKSANGGGTWTAVNSGLTALNVRTIAIHPTTPATIYAGTGSGIYKTTNGGTTWTSTSTGLFDPNINVLVLDPRNPNTLYAATNSVGIFRSTTGGSFWFAANGGLTSSSLGILATALAIDRASGTLYAAVGESNVSRIFKSTTGTSWTPTSLHTARVNAIAIDSGNSNQIYAASNGGSDAFVAKWDAAGALGYSTYVGGYRDDAGNAIAVDSSRNVYIAGNTSSTNFPAVSPVQSAFAGGSEVTTDAFFAKLDAPASGFIYSSFFGGSGNDFGYGIAVDSGGNAYVAGLTGSSDFPTASPVIAGRPGLLDAFLARITDTSTISYSVAARGGVSVTSQGTQTTIGAGYARILPGAGNTAPSGLAIFSLRQNNALVSEAAVPASALLSSGRIYAEVGGGADTGVAIANPNNQTANITFYFTDENGVNTAANTTTIGPNAQIAKFLSGAPFNGGSLVQGTFTFTSSVPVSVIALRGFTNERSEFLMTTLPVTDTSAVASTDSILFPHFAEGGGFTTQFVLVNPADTSLTGSIQFYDRGSDTTLGQPLTLTVDGVVANTFNYNIAPRSSKRLRTAGAGALQTGSVRLVPGAGQRTPDGVIIFTYRKAGITVSEAGVPALISGTTFRLYAESTGNFAAGQIGSSQTGIAIANASAAPAAVTFELHTLAGTSTGLTGSKVVPGNGQVSMFLTDIPGLTTLASPFQGVLRISTASPAGIAVVGLRGRNNERLDFLMTTTQPVRESQPPTSSEQFFPHFADGGGFTTQFVLFNGSADQTSAGSLRFFSDAGQVLSLAVR